MDLEGGLQPARGFRPATKLSAKAMSGLKCTFQNYEARGSATG